MNRFRLSTFDGADRATAPYFLYYVFCFMGIAIFTSFINIYFRQAGFEIAQIGILTALGPIISMASQPMWGTLSDRTNKRRVLMTVLAGSVIMSLILPLSTSFVFLVITLLIYWSFATSLLPLGDAVVLSFLEGKQLKYSAMRVVGAVSFGLTGAFSGLMLGGNVGRIFYYNAVFLSITFVLVYFMSSGKSQKVEQAGTHEAEEPEAPATTAKGKFAEIFSNKIVLGVYLSSFVFGLIMTFLHNFIGIRITEVGGTEGQVGTALFIAAFSEIPLFLFMERLFGDKKPVHLLMFSAFFMGLRLLIMAVGDSVTMIYIAQSIHGVSFIIHLYFCIVLLHRHSPPHLKSTVQTVHAMMRVGAGAILGALAGGFLAQNIGIQGVFMILSVFVLSTCFILPGVLILVHKAKTR